jgi:drug/metabolite transporter (DMT)-like permease
MLCEGDRDKFLETMKQSANGSVDKINTTVSGNNIQNKIDNPSINIDNPNINIHNPDINIPSSVGTAVGKAASSLGIGATTAAGIRAMVYRSNNIPPTARAFGIGVGGLLGGLTFIAGNVVNTHMQNKLDANNSYKDINNNDKNGPFYSNSIIEEVDSVELVINFLYYNLFISMCILFLVILLIYHFKKDKSKVIIIIIITLEIVTFVSYYLAIYLYDDPEII